MFSEGGSFVTDHNLIGTYDPTAAPGFSAANGDQLGSLASPINPVLGSLANNGGPTPNCRVARRQPGHQRRRQRGRDIRRVDERPARFRPHRRRNVDIGACSRYRPLRSSTAGFLFYDDSKFDHNAPGISTSDDNAIATDKTAYLSGTGTATSANVSSYSRGINGIMIDLQGAGNHSSITLANILSDFTFKMGNNNTPSTWATAPSPISVSVRAGAGVGGSDRVELIWADNAIKENWLEVIVKAIRTPACRHATSGSRLAWATSSFWQCCRR